MKLSHLLAGATALAFAAGISASAYAADSATVTFNVSGSVNTTCLISFTNTNMPIGTIPIDTTATGLHNPTTAIYDPTQFTADLDYNAEVGWTGPYGFYGSGQHPNVGQGLPAGTETKSASITNGAFASSMAVTAYIFTSPLALLAGTYTDTITVTLAAS